MKRVYMMMVAAACAAVSVQAADPTLAELQRQLNELSAKIAQLEATNAEKIARLESENSARIAKIEADASKNTVPAWLADTKFKGDFRYRYENRQDNSTSAADRQRVRVRIGASGPVNEYIDYGIRLATGGGATSANQTLGNNNSMFNLYIDRAYVDLHPDQLKGAHVMLGKMPQPWLARTGLLWDGDFNPEGAAVVYSRDFAENMTMHANAGAFIINDDVGSDARMQSAQIAIDSKIGGASVQVGISDYWFENIKNTSFTSWKNVTPNGGFNIIEGFGSVSSKVGDLPVKFYGQAAQNTEAATSDDTAYLVGVKLGKAKKPGSWELGYNWREIGKDSVFGPLNDSDFNDGNTDSRGHAIGAKYQIAKNWQAGLTYLMTKGSAKDADTFQADLNFKF